VCEDDEKNGWMGLGILWKCELMDGH
jgi:hypothetical protein